MDLRDVTHPCPDPVNMSDKKAVFNEATDLESKLTSVSLAESSGAEHGQLRTDIRPPDSESP